MKALTIEKIAHEYGYQPVFIREACNRSPEYHPLPHIKRGAARPVAYIQRDTFEEWLKEEERLQVGLDMTAKLSFAEVLSGIREACEKLEQETAR